MKHFLSGLGFLGVALATWAAQVGTAHAGIGACGDIHVEASAQCEVVAPGASCKGMCTPLSVRAACAAKLAADCEGTCKDLPSVDCTGSCQADCGAACTKLDPGMLDCQGACEADCGGDCDVRCAASSKRAACEASCKGSCSASCQGSCDVELPKGDCDAHCEASCNGSCETDANFDCQLDCQAMGSADCEAEVTGGCELECDTQQGALFCDGQYVDHGDKLDMCIDALRAALDIEVTSEATGEAACTSGSGCAAKGMARAQVSTDCAVAYPGWGSSRLSVLCAMSWLLGLGLVRRRRRRR